MSVTPIQTSVGTLGLLRAHVAKDKRSIVAELRYSVSEQGIDGGGNVRVIKTRTYLVMSFPHLGTWRAHFVGGDGSASIRRAWRPFRVWKSSSPRPPTSISSSVWQGLTGLCLRH